MTTDQAKSLSLLFEDNNPYAAIAAEVMRKLETIDPDVETVQSVVLSGNVLIASSSLAVAFEEFKSRRRS
jgi:hypothetical protein